MITLETIRSMIESLPGATEAPSYGIPGFEVRKNFEDSQHHGGICGVQRVIECDLSYRRNSATSGVERKSGCALILHALSVPKAAVIEDYVEDCIEAALGLDKADRRTLCAQLLA